MYIAVGIGLIVIIIVLILVDKFAPFSEFMSSFKKGTYKKLITVLGIVAFLSLSYGIYHAVTYQPPFLDIETEEGSRTVFGDIGNIGYYAEGLVKKDEVTNVRLVTWDSLDAGDSLEIAVIYPSGKEEVWQSSVNRLESNGENLQSEHGVEEVYELESHRFEESGKVKLNIEDEKTLTIDVKKK